ncbi:hypothetical protein KSP39_PZI004664 [Platanthera zijinensis]|uniref:DUF7804 domain-containing protein n=1 Tax=Platanthera zijinensis TaxID=2320716 RepID=A0AAP0BV30_9ASPA
MASMSSALEIAGGGIRPAIFGQRQFPRNQSLQINRTCRSKASASARLTFHPDPAQATNIAPVRLDLLSSFTGRGRDERERITPEMLEEMIHESVDEIVRNIGRAPFLMLVFLDEGGRGESESESRWRLCSSSSPPLILEREAATAESWQRIKKRWEEDSCVPDGVILVEQLEGEKEKEGMVGSGEEGDGRRWGVVIEGRGMDFSACFILKTCRVRSSMGYCTHYSLVRAQCFGDPVGVQLMNAWLQPER